MKNKNRSSLRVTRGGSWFSAAVYCRAAYRDGKHPADRDRSRGFRLVLHKGVKNEEQK